MQKEIAKITKFCLSNRKRISNKLISEIEKMRFNELLDGAGENTLNQKRYETLIVQLELSDFPKYFIEDKYFSKLREEYCKLYSNKPIKALDKKVDFICLIIYLINFYNLREEGFRPANKEEKNRLKVEEENIRKIISSLEKVFFKLKSTDQIIERITSDYKDKSIEKLESSIKLLSTYCKKVEKERLYSHSPTPLIFKGQKGGQHPTNPRLVFIAVVLEMLFKKKQGRRPLILHISSVIFNSEIESSHIQGWLKSHQASIKESFWKLELL